MCQGGDFLQGRDTAIPVKGLGRCPLSAFLSKSFAPTSGPPGSSRLEKPSRREQMPLGGGRRAPPCGCSNSSLEVAKDSPSERRARKGSKRRLHLQIHPAPSTPSPPPCSLPFITCAYRGRVTLRRLAQVPPRTTAARQLLKAPRLVRREPLGGPQTKPHPPAEVLNRTKYRNRRYSISVLHLISQCFEPLPRYLMKFCHRTHKIWGRLLKTLIHTVITL